MQTGRAPALLKVKFFILREDYSTSDGRARGGGGRLDDRFNFFVFCSAVFRSRTNREEEKEGEEGASDNLLPRRI